MYGMGEAYLRLQFWSGALADAELAESTTRLSKEHRDKALYRAARAQYARGNYEAAETRFTEWHRSHPDDRDVLEWIARSRERLRESQNGSYDWLKLLKQSEKCTRLDVADYRGPIQVTQLQGRGGGRGVVASKDICVGELLLVSKPFISVFEDDLRGNVIQLAADMLSSKLKTRTQSAAVAFVAQKLYGNPDLHDHVFGLYAGPDYPAPPSSYPPEVSKAARAVDPLYPSTDIDIAQLDAICTYNAFQAMPIRPNDVQSQGFEKPTALHLLPSLFNHSCVPNAIWNCIGDVMVVRAMDTISAGAEITMPYSLEPSYVQREHALRDHMLSGCDCWLCNADRADGDTALRRRDALEDKYRPSTLRSTSLSLLSKWEKDFLSTYHTSRGPVRPSMYAPHVLLAEKLWSSHASNSFRESIDENMKALTCLGYKIQTNKSQPTKGNSKRKGMGTLPIERSRIPTSTAHQFAIVVMLKLILLYTQVNDKVNATKWLKAANWGKSLSVARCAHQS
ncbi:uncharacterized protein LAESUDRAFT_176403 [Laetiporus sulphureus 93-53]|uniref:SET domain-containing protein n=1 Tax=Laetiporus sulphureus 93-53 TaxID=1314785 RepID=A0A165E7R6_9APHY|nr:uncharacterized protein LAESUDRAFT_176403 [Laetiporus sulphureus 93-53]KZT06404.1 hypothetical protein LAESUDRAFT_176403 [Laetiporus sulphureus 93-53]